MEISVAARILTDQLRRRLSGAEIDLCDRVLAHEADDADQIAFCRLLVEFAAEINAHGREAA